MNNLAFEIIKPTVIPELVTAMIAAEMVHEADPAAMLELFLAKNPELSYLVRDPEKSNEIIGFCLNSFNGMRGYISRLFVKEEYRKQGVGRELIRLCEEKLKKVGCQKVTINCELDLTPWYEKQGYNKRNLVYLSKPLT